MGDPGVAMVTSSLRGLEDEGEGEDEDEVQAVEDEHSDIDSKREAEVALNIVNDRFMEEEGPEFTVEPTFALAPAAVDIFLLYECMDNPDPALTLLIYKRKGLAHSHAKIRVITNI